MSEDKLDTLLHETRIYEPPSRIVDVAYVKKVEDYHKKAEEDLEAFWDEAAKELGWFEPYTQVLDESNAPFFKWFVNGKTNIVHNALDRHMGTETENHIAIIYEGEPGDTRKVTYRELNDEVCKFANALKKLGVKKGDRITTYLPNLIEHAVALLATAKLGAMHSVVYAGFSATALRERIEDSQSTIVITADGLWRRGKQIPLKATVDEAVTQAPSVEKVIVVDRVEGMTVEMKEGRDLWYHDLIKEESTECATEVMDSYDPLFILYTSGTTSKPKGVQHGHGGYQVGISRTLKWVFNIKKEDIWWCTADLGWITGHSYILYGPLILGTTSLMYESVPDYPDPDHWWELVEKYKVTKFYTAPTAIRAIARYGDDWVKKHDLSSLRILGSVGEPINPEAWIWYHEVVGNEQCPIMDTYWQTETGAFMLTPVPTQKLKPGSATKTFPGVFAAIVDGMGKELPRNTGGFLVIKRPWPSMLQTLYKNPDRYVKTYWSDIEVDGKPVYKTGDMARQDEDGYFWIQGRSDDVVNISGHRIGTMEVESAVVSHEVVAECAVIGVPDEIRGEILKAFVVLRKGIEETDELKITLKKHVRKEIGPIVVFKDIEFMEGLPKTRSGKIMRRVLKARELGLDTGDTSTLAD